MGRQEPPVVAIETTIDDMNPQVYDWVMERLFKAGALEVTLQPVQAKKNRPAIILRCLAPQKKRDAICDIILKETTTFGVRYYPVERKILERRMEKQTTRWGVVRMKVGIDKKGNVVKRVPEYDDVKRLAKKTGRSFYEITNTSTIMATKRRSK
ncbi:MAG: DUF111 family protein [Deltaproteobacteria bacterium]|nr:DUF111 family protein [Deltaproteobacteria bacterium]